MLLFSDRTRFVGMGQEHCASTAPATSGSRDWSWSRDGDETDRVVRSDAASKREADRRSRWMSWSALGWVSRRFPSIIILQKLFTRTLSRSTPSEKGRRLRAEY